MKTRAIGLLIAAGLVALGLWSVSRRNQRHARSPKPEVTIQDGKTIDFSSGKPVVKDDAKEQKAIASSVAVMDEATKNVTFSPTATTQTSSTDATTKK